MTKTAIELNEKITDVLEAHDMRVCSIEEQDGQHVAEVEFWSPAGEDMSVTIWYDGTGRGFIEKFREYADDFDPDEHAEELVEYRGQNGVPSSIRTLIDDADEIARMLEDTAIALSAIDCKDEDEQYIRANWETVLNSKMEATDISCAIRWGFYQEDLAELMRLHQADICREKIEDLLTDCNFHSVCSAWSDGDYSLPEMG